MKHISIATLKTMLEGIISCQPVSVDVETIPSMNKTGNPFYGRVMKASTVNGLIGFIYGNAVNNQLSREDKEMTFTSHPRKWGVREGVLINHKEKTYLEIKVQSVSSTAYLLDGEEIELADLGGWIKPRTAPKTQDGIEKKIILADYKLDSIKAIRMGKEEYEITEQVQEAERVEVEHEEVEHEEVPEAEAV